MRLLHLTCAAALALAASASRGHAQADSRQSAPALVVDSFFRASTAERWSDAARFLDLEAISALRDRMVRNARRQRPLPPVTVETLLEADPQMPREVAEYQARKSNEARQNVDVIGFEFAHVPSVDSLAALPAADVGARWLEAQGMRWRVREQLAVQRGHGCELPDSVVDAIIASRSAGVRVLGTVVGDSLAWVLHEEQPRLDSDTSASPRRRAGSARRGYITMPPDVTTLRRVNGGIWRIAPGYGYANASFAMVCQPVRPTRSTPP